MGQRMSKPAFDPNQPFESSAKPAFDPNQPFTAGDQSAPIDNSGSFPEARNVMNSNQGLAGKAWDMLQVPSQMAGRGLNAMAGAVPEPEPTGNLPMDILKGTPKIAANTLAQAAPGFVSRASMLTAGASNVLQALRPVGSVVGKAVAGEAENLTNAVPGSLGRAWNDPTLIFAKGKSAASGLYNAGKAELEQGANLFKDMYKPDEIIDTAKAYLDKGGKLEPAEALIYRKALDIVGRSRNVVKDGLVNMRGVADDAVKESDNLSAADATFKRGLDAESLRRLVPQNKYGGSSAFKMALMGALGRILGPAGAGLLSPAVHGAVATAGGIAERVATNPQAAVAAQQLFDEYQQRHGGSNGSR